MLESSGQLVSTYTSTQLRSFVSCLIRPHLKSLARFNLALLAVALLSACAEGENKALLSIDQQIKEVGEITQTAVGVLVAKGRVSGSECTLYDGGGAKLGSTTTKVDGTATFGSYAGIDKGALLYVICSGGVYEDEATGQPTQASWSQIRGGGVYSGTQMQVVVTPLTEIAFQKAEKDLSKLDDFNRSVAKSFGLGDAFSPQSRAPFDTKSGSETLPNNDSGRYAAVLAAFSQAVKEGQGKNAGEMITTYAECITAAQGNMKQSCIQDYVTALDKAAGNADNHHATNDVVASVKSNLSNALTAPSTLKGEVVFGGTATNAYTCAQGTPTYQSSDVKVATVDDQGRVTAQGVGSASIEVTCPAEGGLLVATTSYTLTVTAKPIAGTSWSFAGGSPPSGVQVDAATQAVTVPTSATSFSRTLTVSDSACGVTTVGYSSDNTAVATVDSATGVVSLVGAGSTTIKAQVASANCQAGDYSYALNVIQSVPNVATAPASLVDSVVFGGTATNAYTCAQGTPSYQSSDVKVATVDDQGRVTAQGVGSASIEVTCPAEGGLLVATTSYPLTVTAKPIAGTSWSFAGGSPPSGVQVDATTQAVTALTSATSFSRTLTVPDSACGVTTVYSSDTTAVATVDSATGVVSLVGAGSTTIKAQVASVNCQAGDYSYQLTVQASENSVLKTGSAFTLAYAQSLDLAQSFSCTNTASSPTFAVKQDGSQTEIAVTQNTMSVISAGDGQATVLVTCPAQTGFYLAASREESITLTKATPALTWSGGGDSSIDYTTDASFFTQSLAVQPAGCDIGGGLPPASIKYALGTPSTTGASVSEQSGQVTVQEAGKVGVTGSVAETDNCEAAQASYELTVNPIANTPQLVAAPSFRYGEDISMNQINTTCLQGGIVAIAVGSQSSSLLSEISTNNLQAIAAGTGSVAVTCPAVGSLYSAATEQQPVTITKAPLTLAFTRFDPNTKQQETGVGFTHTHRYGLMEAAALEVSFTGFITKSGSVQDTQADLTGQLTYTTSDTAIATVDSNGRVQPVTGSVGKNVTITLNYSGGSRYADATASYTLAIRGESPKRIYSLRRWPGYTGDAFRAYRVNDGVEQNIGFDASGDLDTNALLLFSGGSEVRIHTWYDQSGKDAGAGNAVDLIDVRHRPTVVKAGQSDMQRFSVGTKRPAVSFESNQLRLTTDIGEVIAGTDYAIFSTIERVSESTDFSYLLGVDNGSTNTALHYGLRWRTGQFTLAQYANDINVVVNGANVNAMTGILAGGLAGQTLSLRWNNTSNTSNSTGPYVYEPGKTVFIGGSSLGSFQDLASEIVVFTTGIDEEGFISIQYDMNNYWQLD